MDDARVVALMDRVSVEADRPLGPYDEPDLEVRLRDGRRLTHHVPVPRGSPDRPLDGEHLLRKDEAVAAPVIGAKRFHALKDAILALDRVGDFREVTALLRPA
jgi:2-methylcitrate dehydratase PrpD